MKSKPVEFFFSNWHGDSKLKESFHEWVRGMVENEPVSQAHTNGFTVENASPFVEKAVRTCIVPLLNMRESIAVDFMEMPDKENSFTLQLKIQEKNGMMDDFLSGF